MKAKGMKLASIKECTGCMGCINSCNHDVLDYEFDKNGYFRVVVKDQSKCTGCGLCSITCPVITSPKTRNTDSRGYAGWNENSVMRKSSASGGIFSAVASYILLNGGIVYGASVDGFNIRHTRITTLDELIKLQGTKYQLSILGNDIFKQVRRDLIAGKTVLYSGMSCQIDALYNFLGKNSTDNLITIDTICGGFSTILPMLQLQNSNKYSEIVSFRDKDRGWKSQGFRYNLKMRRVDGTIAELGYDNIVTRIFSTHLLKNSPCLSCKFNGLVRNSDMTIGDFWGTDRFSSEHVNGLSCVIAHNQKAIDLLKSSAIELREVSIGEIAKGNANLYWSKYNYLRHSISRKLALLCLRHQYNSTALKICSYTGSWSLGWRLYMRFNNRLRENYCKRDTISNE